MILKKLLLFSGPRKYFEDNLARSYYEKRQPSRVWTPLFPTIRNCNGDTNQFKFRSIANLKQ